ncbi:FtsX-like permease family protein [Streptomyces sp. NPDC087525]|uniref:FtsX-like permease family protein n=1 Tax=Streptomyces sp. NPDC087525 TaxID=3365793 RepID=UPI003802DAB4
MPLGSSTLPGADPARPPGPHELARNHDSPARTRHIARFLAGRSMRVHTRAWTAVFAALLLTSLVLSSFGLAVLSAALGHASVERYGAAAAVVAGDQETRFTAKPWGSKRQTQTAALTERVRVPRSVLPRIEAVPGVRAAIADDTFPVALTGADGSLVAGPDSDSGASPVYGHTWRAAALAPFTLRDGRAPAGPGQVVLDGDLAERAGAGVGDEVRLQSTGAPETYRVSGIAAPEGRADDSGLGNQGAVFFSDERARLLAGHPETTDAIGVLADPGVSAGTLHARLREALDGERPARSAAAGTRYKDDNTSLRVLTGNGRGETEFVTSAPSRMSLLALLGSVCALVVLIALLVVSSTVAQAIHQRSREMALLRAVGATPRQLRAMVGREVNVVAATAAVAGAIGAVPVFLALIKMLRTRGAVPVGLELPAPFWMYAAPLVTGALTVLVARIAAAIACGRIAKVRPAQAMGEAQSEAEQFGRGRAVTGVVMLVLGCGAAGTAVLQFGELAAMAASTAAVCLVIACALLGPWIAWGAMRVLGVPAERLGGAGGYLAAAASRANSRRLGAAITPIVLVVAFAGVQLSAGATLDTQGGRQAGQAMRAELAVTTDGPGIPDETVRRVKAVPGVAAASGVLHSTVVLARKEAGEPRLDRLPVMALDPSALPATIDPKVTSGDLGDLRAGTVAVGEERARSLDLDIGSKVTVRYGDGANVPLRVAAVYERSLALGDFLFAPAELAPHLAAPLNTRVLLSLAPGAALQDVKDAVRRELAGAAPGATVTERPKGEHLRTEDRGVGQVISLVAVSVIGGFTVIAVLSTLVLIMVGRRQEIILLRLVGAGRRQIRWMLRIEAMTVMLVGLVVGTVTALVPLLAFSLATTGSWPYMPPGQAGLVVLAVVVTAGAGYVLPLRSVLRKRPPTVVGHG